MFFNRYGRDYADPYLGHGIGPVAGYGVRRNNLNCILVHCMCLNLSCVKCARTACFAIKIQFLSKSYISKECTFKKINE